MQNVEELSDDDDQAPTMPAPEDLGEKGDKSETKPPTADAKPKPAPKAKAKGIPNPKSKKVKKNSPSASSKPAPKPAAKPKAKAGNRKMKRPSAKPEHSDPASNEPLEEANESEPVRKKPAAAVVEFAKPLEAYKSIYTRDGVCGVNMKTVDGNKKEVLRVGGG